MQETWVWSLGQEDPLEEGMATHSSILAWRIPWTGEPGRLQSMGSQRVGYDSVTNTHSIALQCYISFCCGGNQLLNIHISPPFWASLPLLLPTRHFKLMNLGFPIYMSWEDPWGREWQPTPLFLPGEPHGQRCLAGYSPWGQRQTRLKGLSMHVYERCKSLGSGILLRWVRLSYLGPVSCSFPSWVPSGCTAGRGWWLKGHSIFCLLIRQAIVFHP